MDFEQSFTSWLNKSLAQNVPDSVKAFCFNLYESAFVDEAKFGVELIGAGKFDRDDPDWPCYEVWEPETRGINIPISYSGDEWELCLQRIKTLVLKQLETETSTIRKLKSTRAVGIGFVDGDLEIIWKS